MMRKYFLILCLIIAIFSIAGVSASENINQVFTTDEISTDISEGALGVSLDEISNDTLSVSDEEVLTAGDDWYVNGSAVVSGDGSLSNPFNNFIDALQKAQDGDTIHFAAGTYSGELNVGLGINYNINLVNWGDEEVIFDGTGRNLRSIFDIRVSHINITGLTFKNGKHEARFEGGALTFYKPLSNSHINAKFINNSVKNGAAIYFKEDVTNCIIEGDFINNSASENGGAINFGKDVKNTTFNGNFINNSANKGGAIYFANESIIEVHGDFINNNASLYGGAFYLVQCSNSNFTANFINNSANQGGAWYCNNYFQDSNITGDFVNNNANDGGAIYMSSHTFVRNQLNANFINNKATRYGGAINLQTFNDNNIAGNFINNSAKDAGAISVYYTTGNFSDNNNITATFINNIAEGEGAAIYFTISNTSKNNFIKGLFINNTAKSIIYIGTNGDVIKINNNIFLNNERDYDINFNGTNLLNVDNNWFGYNNTNYKTNPLINGTVICATWLFLNATANHVTLESLEESEIKFKLFSYDWNNNKIVEYNHTLLKPVNLTVTSTNGNVDKDIIGFNETVTFTPTKIGTARVTASVEDAQDTIELNVHKADPKLSVNVNSIDFGENATFELSYNNTATGKVNITLYRKESARTYMYTDLDINETISFFDKYLIPGTYNVTVTYSGDNVFNNDTANTTFTISKINPLVELIAHDINVTDVDALLFTITLKKNCPIDTLTWNITPKDSKHKYNIENYSDENGNIVYDILNFHNPEGEYLLNIASLNKDYYDDFTENAIAHIFRLDPKLSFENQEMNYSKEIKIALNYNNTATGTVNINLTGEKHNYIFSADINETISLSNVLPDEYEVSVDYNGDLNFKNATARAVLTVNKLDFDIKLEAFDINVTDINKTMFLVTVPYGYDREVGWNQTPAKYEKSRIDGEGVYYIDVRNGGNPAGEYFDYINCTGSDIYNDVFINVTSHILRLDPGLSVSADSINYTENATFKLSYNNTATGKVTINVKGTKYNKVYSDLDINETISFFDPYICAGEYNVTVKYSGDDIFTNDTANTTFTVNKINPLLELKGHNISVTDINASLFTLTFSSPMNSGLTISITPAGCKFENKSSFDDEGNPVLDMLNLGNPAGEYLLNFTSRNSDYYNDFTANATAYIFKLDPELSVEDNEIDYGEEVKISLNYNNTATGKVNVTLTGEKHNYTFSADINETILLQESILPGEYEVSVVYSGDYNFTNATDDAILVINKLDITPEITYDNATFNVTVPLNVTGNMTLNIANKTLEVPVVNGTAVFDLSDMPDGDYKANVTYPGDDIYNGFEKIEPVLIETPLKIIVENLTKYYNGSERLNVTVTDSKGYPKAGQTVEISINGVTYNRTTDENGAASLNINLNSGEYVAEVSVGSESKNVTVTVLSTVKGSDIEKTFMDNTTYDVSVLDSEGNPLEKGTEVSFNIDGVFYSAEVDDNGVAHLKVDLPVGEYVVTATNPVTGESAANNITVNKAASVISMKTFNVSVDDASALIANITLPKYAEGHVIVTICNESTTADINNKTVDIVGDYAYLPVYNKNLSAGDYNISVTLVDDNYLPSTANGTFTVNKKDIAPKITQNGIVLTVDVPGDATGNVTLTVGNETFTSPIVNGTALFVLSDVPEGVYNATVKYPGDDKYNGFEEISQVTIESDEIIIIAPDLTKYYHGPERFIVDVITSKGVPIVNQTVQITINGVTYYRTTDENGTASLAINLHSGEFDTLVTVNDTNITAKVTVLPTVNGTDLTKVFKSNDQYYVTVRYSNGTYLEEGSAVEFNIHGMFYTRHVVGNKGLVELNINLEQGDYIVTATNLVTGEQASNNITVIPRIIENYDTVLYFRNGTQFTAIIIGDDFNVSGAGIEVKFNIHGVFYTRVTDENGIVNLNINLEPGDYIITSECIGCKVSNTVKVLPVLTSEDISMKSGDGTLYKAKLVDGQGKAFAKQKITTNINGRFYERTTDSNGIITINLDNLPAGEYIPTSSYGVNGAVVSTKITISS